MDPRLKAVFMAASSPAAATNQALSGPQAADIVWACGLLCWLPADDDTEGGDVVAAAATAAASDSGGSSRRLAQLVELVARTASAKSGIDDGHVTNVLWALERLGVSAPPTEITEKRATGHQQQAEKGGEEISRAGPGVETAAIAGNGEGGGREAWKGNKAVQELRRKVESLPFRAIPSLFEGLRVEDFKEEVAFGRDEILLGGGKVRFCPLCLNTSL